MTTVAIVALAVSLATAVGALVWLTRRSLARADERGDLRVEVAELRATNANWQTETEAVREALRVKSEELARETAARRLVERQRDDAVSDLAKSGDPRGVAAAIRAQLRRSVPAPVSQVPPPKPANDH